MTWLARILNLTLAMCVSIYAAEAWPHPYEAKSIQAFMFVRMGPSFGVLTLDDLSSNFRRLVKTVTKARAIVDSKKEIGP